jgi:hypothetical protein
VALERLDEGLLLPPVLECHVLLLSGRTGRKEHRDYAE